MERAIYRIIDANFNRAREAARVMEEYCRFALESAVLSWRAKELRHRLSRAVDRLDARMLAAARDSAGDVGRGMTVGDQMVRRSLADCSTAAAKRLTEANTDTRPESKTVAIAAAWFLRKSINATKKAARGASKHAGPRSW